ncbi:MAG: IS630 family transposase [Bacteroidetes bacterium]|nr:IS630 family transposase [Bacteroidota bacterium]
MAKYKVTLTKEESEELMSIINKGKHTSQKYRNAYILLNCDQGEYSEKVTNAQISKILKVGMRTIDRVKKRFVEEGFEAILERKPPDREYERKADGDLEAHLIALSCSDPPEGYARWSLRLLADKVVELKYVESISYETVRRTPKKNELKPWKVQRWVIPKTKNGQFVANMEQVLDVYKRPYDEKYPVVCMDESPKQLIRETRESIEAKPGRVKRVDYEYERCGTCNIFMASEPLIGQRYVKVTERKTKKDWAIFVKQISDEYYRSADRITLVMDNLNTHQPGSLYEVFKPAEAKRIWDRFEFVYTPKHGSWLNMAEIELNVLQGQCLSRRIDKIDKVKKEIKAWEESRNNKKARIDWQFKTKNARIKLKRLYPSIHV